MSITLYGYHYSVYTRIVKMVLAAKALSYSYLEVDPFAQNLEPAYLELHPFGRVPVIRHGAFTLYETVAIARYLDEVSAPVMLSPKNPENRARMVQIVSMVDNYGYWPMVRQVFSHRVFRAAEGREADEYVVAAGRDASQNVCAALEKLVYDGEFLTGAAISYADLHLGAMMDYFTAAPEGREIVNCFPRLSRWWQGMADHALLQKTNPGLPAV